MLQTGTLSEVDLLAHAEGRAVELGHRAVGTPHLLLAMLELECGHCSDLLRAEPLEPERVIEAAAALDSEGIPEAGDTPDEGPPVTRKLQEIGWIGHEFAVLYESDGVWADHLLLAIAVDGEGSAAELLEEAGKGTGGRLDAALVEALAPEESAGWAPLTITAREAIALAWARALAIGSAEIEVEDVLRALSAPGWTLGARTLEMLGAVPDWQPASWQGAEGGVPYQRIPFAEPCREMLRLADEESRALSRACIGTEHLLLGAARGALPALAEFSGRDIAPAEVREAVARSVIEAEAAREAEEAEERRHGGQPEPEEGAGTQGKLLAVAREAIAMAGGDPSGEEPVGCWPAFVAAIHLNDDEDLGDLLEDMQLVPKEIHSLARDERDVPFAAATQLPGEPEDPGPLDAIGAVLARPSPRVAAALDRLGLTPRETRAQIAEWQLRRDGDDPRSFAVLAVGTLSMLISTITSIALLQAVIAEGDWWKLIFLPLVWSGYPGFGPIGDAAVAAVLGYAVSPLVGGLHLLGIPFEVLQAHVERGEAWARTGVRLTLRELRCVKRRQLDVAGRFNQLLRQLARADMRKLVRRVARRRG